MSFVDESGIDQYLHRERCRALKGEQIYESVPERKFDTVLIDRSQAFLRRIFPLKFELFLRTQ